MPNPSYLAGVRLEREIINLLKKHLNSERYTIIRTAGSHSPVDVIVLKHVENKGVDRAYFGIQCKTKKNATTRQLATAGNEYKRQYSA